jgi:hypothetical protein
VLRLFQSIFGGAVDVDARYPERVVDRHTPSGSARSEAGVLQFNLDMLSEVLSRAEQQLWATPITLILDRMNSKRDRARDNALEIGLEELHSASGRTAILLPMVIPRSELRPRTDLLVEAQRYLA